MEGKTGNNNLIHRRKDPEKKITEKQIVKIAAACAALVLLIFRFAGMPCTSRYLFGISCPGCGMTRAWLSAVSLDFEQAFYYHPFFLGVPLAGLVVAVRKKMPSWLFFAIIALIIAAYLAVYFYRLIYSDNAVVYPDLKEGLVFKLWKGF